MKNGDLPEGIWDIQIWVCLKMLGKPHCTQWLYNDHYPVMKNG